MKDWIVSKKATNGQHIKCAVLIYIFKEIK